MLYVQYVLWKNRLIEYSITVPGIVPQPMFVVNMIECFIVEFTKMPLFNPYDTIAVKVSQLSVNVPLIGC